MDFWIITNEDTWWLYNFEKPEHFNEDFVPSER